MREGVKERERGGEREGGMRGVNQSCITAVYRLIIMISSYEL